MREDVLKREADGTFPLWKAVVGGMVSGALAQFLSSPADVIKVRMQLDYGRRRAGLPPLYGYVIFFLNFFLALPASSSTTTCDDFPTTDQ